SGWLALVLVHVALVLLDRPREDVRTVVARHEEEVVRAVRVDGRGQRRLARAADRPGRQTLVLVRVVRVVLVVELGAPQALGGIPLLAALRLLERHGAAVADGRV